MLGKFISEVLIRIYITVLIVWIMMLVIATLQTASWPVDIFRTAGFWTLGVIVVGLIHWFILYKKDTKHDADQKPR